MLNSPDILEESKRVSQPTGGQPSKLERPTPDNVAGSSAYAAYWHARSGFFKLTAELDGIEPKSR